MVKKKTSYLQRKQKDEVNKKAIVWISSVLAGFVVLMTILLIIDK